MSERVPAAIKFSLMVTAVGVAISVVAITLNVLADGSPYRTVFWLGQAIVLASVFLNLGIIFYNVSRIGR